MTTRNVLPVLGLYALSIMQPILDLMGRYPEYLAIQQLSPYYLVGILLGLSLLFVTLALFGKITTIIGYIFLCILFSCGFLKAFQLHNYLFIALTCGAGVGLALFIAQTSAGAFFGRIISPAFLLVPSLFIFNPNIKSLLVNDSVEHTIATSNSRTTPIIFLVFDELPTVTLLNKDGEIDAARYPGFGELRTTSTWFQYATSPAAWTERAIPTLLTGLLPKSDTKQLPIYQEHKENLFTLFARAGLRPNVFEQISQLCPVSLCSTDKTHNDIITLLADLYVLLARRILPDLLADKIVPDISSSWGNFFERGIKPSRIKGGKGFVDTGELQDDRVIFERFLESFDHIQQPALNFLHITFPHVPYRVLPSGKRYVRNLDNTNERGYKKNWASDDHWPALQGQQRHILQTMAADALLVRLITKLKKLNIWDGAWIVVTADHGSSFTPGEFSRRVTANNFAEVMGVPLFIKQPGQLEGSINKSNAQTFDIVPTLAGAFGLDNANFSGRDLFADSLPTVKLFYPLETRGSQPLELPPLLEFSHFTNNIFTHFGNGSDLTKLYGIAPDQRGTSQFVGRTADSISPSAFIKLAESTYDIINHKDYAVVDLKSDYIPALLVGELYKDRLGARIYHDIPILIALNNLITAETKTTLESGTGKIRFRAMLNEAAFVNGQNKLEIYLKR